MADLLFKKLVITICALAFFCQSAYSFESSFPFPFEFGHSSDIYLDLNKNQETKQQRQEKQAALERLREAGISNSPKDFVKYIKKNDIGAVKMLLDAGFDPNMSINANYPVYYAARYNRKQILYLLLDKGANPNKDFTSPLRYAVLRNDYDMAKALIDHGANVNYYDTVAYESLLYTALRKKEYEIAILLLNSKAKIDVNSYRLIKNKNLERKLGITLD